jgi:hypothetical protein
MQNYINKNLPANSSSKDIPLPSTIDYSANKGDGSIPHIQKEVGSLRFLADRTKPDILTAVGMLGSAAATPSEEHVKGVKHLGQYLKSVLGEGVTYGGSDKEVLLFGYCDASYLPRSKSRIGYAFFLNLESGTIYSRSFTDKTVSHSSCEVEIKAIDEAIRQVIWLRGFLTEIGFPQLAPTVLYTDSISAKTLIDSFQVGNNSAHLVMRLNYLHECVENKLIELKYINTLDQVADILTKLLPYPAHQKFKQFLLEGHNQMKPQSVFKSQPKPKTFDWRKNILKKK